MLEETLVSRLVFQKPSLDAFKAKLETIQLPDGTGTYKLIGKDVTSQSRLLEAAFVAYTLAPVRRSQREDVLINLQNKWTEIFAGQG